MQAIAIEARLQETRPWRTPHPHPDVRRVTRDGAQHVQGPAQARFLSGIQALGSEDLAGDFQAE